MADKKKILILSTEFGTEADELQVPLQQLKAKGHDVTLATPGGQDVQTMKADKELGPVIPADKAVADVAGEFDVIVLPGGTINADTARGDADIQRLVTEQARAGRTVAAICHAPWVLVETELVKGKQLTSYESIKTDVTNAGGEWTDREVVVDDAAGFTLITSRNPDDLPAFVGAIDEA